MHFDLTITLGNVLQTVVILLAIIAGYVRLREQLVAIQTKIEPLWDEYTDRAAQNRKWWADPPRRAPRHDP